MKADVDAVIEAFGQNGQVKKNLRLWKKPVS